MSAPMKKRIRREVEESTTTTTTSNHHSHHDLESVVHSLQNHVRNTTTSIDELQNLSLQFLKLKAMQRTIMADHLAAATDKIQQSKCHQQTAQLQALQYEQAHLKQHIELCRDFRTPYLEKIATTETKITHNSEAAIQEYLGSVQDTTRKETIIAKLHQEMEQRKTLQQQLQEKQKKLTQLQNDLAEKEKFLNNLPDQVERLEKASLNLQKFVHQHSHEVANHQIGSERSTRIQMARTLPTPLYTLFNNLQHAIDQEQPTLTNISIKNREVILRLPIPINNKKHVSIHFEIEKDDNDVGGTTAVTAQATGAHTALRQDILLQELFPNDTKSHWCSLLAGIWPAGTAIRASTRVILRELRQRISSNATLKHILSHWEKKQWIALEGDEWSLPDGVKWKTYSMDESDPRKASATVGFENGAESLEAKVTIDLATYPAQPPVWSLNDQDQYEEKFTVWESKINLDLLEKNADSTSQDTFDWIIVDQLKTLLQKWTGETIDDAARPYRGRNRVPNDPMETD